MTPKKNALEWTVFGASLLIIGATITLLLTGGSGSGNPGPDLRVAAGTPAASSSGFAVPVTVENQGDATAEQVRVEVSLLSGGEERETGELTIAFVPRRSRREGWVVFQRDPACCTISARAVSFEKP